MLSAKCILWILVQVVVGQDKYQPARTDKYEYQELVTPIAKSANDEREYLGLVLSNKMKVLLISDPTTDLAAAALDVAVGSMADPEFMPGLAHFCEHLLFMGNKKYPKTNSYFEHLKSNGGEANAYTSYDHTNYFFSVNYDSLESTLDRFSQFFISPLFSAESVEKEVNAVNSEHQKNIQSDMWRIDQVQKYTLNQSHPFSHFSTGTYDTLYKIPKSKGIDPRQEIIKYYNKYYSANQMRLVVLGRESLDQLKNMTVSKFSNVRNSKIPRPSIPFSPFSKDDLGVEIDINPVENSQKLIMQFPLPSQAKFYREKPSHLLSHFLGHESTGSIMEYLKEVGWATSISTGLSEENINFSMLDVGVELTPLGLENKDTIVQLVLEYAKLAKENGITKNYFDEMASINEIKFRFQERMDPSTYTSALAGAMQNPSPLSKTLSSPYLMTRFAPELMQKMFGYITQDNLRLSVVAKIPDAQLKEPWYGTKYSIKKLPQLKPTGIKLQLPPPNTYIPNNFDLTDTNPQMQMLRNNSQAILWYAGNPTKTPKVNIYMLLKNNMASRSPDLKVKMDLMAGIVEMQLNAFGYNARLAGLTYSIVSTANGLVLTFSGYNQKMEPFISDVLNRIKEIELSESAFKVYKAKRIQDIENAQFDMPAAQGLQLTKIAMVESTWTREMQLSALPTISYPQLSEFTKHLLGSAKLEMLVVGNLDRHSANRIMDVSLKTLRLTSPADDLLHPTRSIVPPESNFVAEMHLKNKDEPNSANVFYLDMHDYTDLVSRTSTQLLGKMLSEPAFDQLRTKEQLGYIANARMAEMNSRGGLIIYIQSERDPTYLESRIENMLQNFQQSVEKMPEEEFQHQVKALKSSIFDKQRNLQETAEFHWETIHSGFYDFTRGNIYPLT
ncbi:metalloprotease [Entomophthora muscae]|uniref:Metalloprotease n=1 Tax=Entomophthora muscae TaxID=34485 RepID=A0ACC2UU92_9FUNG|nr:metalloprotease [Entomophthora muscae]